MKKRIYFSIIWLVVPCVLVLAVLLSVVFHSEAKKQELGAVRDHALLLAELLNNGVYGDFNYSDYINVDPETTRMTVISPEGVVLLDSRSSAAGMENHADRPEVISALRDGNGDALRLSGTMRTEMYYYALRLGDGNVLRLSRPVGGIAKVFAVSLPVAAAITLLVLLIARFIARALTNRIMEPLKDIGFSGVNFTIYDELQPYVEKIDGQKRELDEKIAELSERAGTIEAITGNMNEGLILINSGAVVLTANKSARGIFGDNMEHRSILHICREAEFSNSVDRCLAGDNVDMLMERAGRVFSVSMSPVCSGAVTNGATVLAEKTGQDRGAFQGAVTKGATDRSMQTEQESPVISSAVIKGAVILFQDATERYQAERQRREFSANVSHELKTPLTTISALSEMIGSGIAKEDDVKSFAARITEQSGRLLALIDDIIRLSEFDEGGAVGDKTVFDLWELAEAVIKALRDNADRVDIRLTGERFSISANSRMIDELLYNLIDNAVKYNKGGGSVNVELEREDGSFCRISVSDDGIGIPAEHQAHVFERFYRVDKSRSKKTGGTGLGLSIVKHIAEYHGGRAELHSVEGEGTTVTCRLMA